jgi:LytS/YehU family sensor histidine kinase
MFFGPFILAIAVFFLGGSEGLSAALVLVALGVVGAIAAVVADAARKKGRTFSTFFWLSYLVSPIVMGIIVATLPPLTKPSNSVKTSGNSSDSAEIEKLASLRDSGVLSEEEFASAKRRLLGG